MIGDKIKELRTNSKISQLNLGEILGVTQQAVGKWENGKAEPDSDMICKIAQYFNVSTDYLLEYETPEQLTGIYFKLGKEAEKMGLDEEDVETILKLYQKHRNNNQ